MGLDQQAQVLRIFLRERDRHDGRPMDEAILTAARDAGIAGATVIRAHAGFGETTRVKRASILRLTDDLPLIIEIVDTTDKIQAFLPVLEQIAESKIMTLENVRVIGRRLGV
jgi:uncharacterized protein